MILFVDDETIRMESYREELKLAGYSVQYEFDVDSAMMYFKENLDKIKLVILDVMMPPGNIFNSIDTEDSLRTGIRFYEKIRIIKSMIPIVIFTNVYDEKIINEIEKDPKSLFYEKRDLLPFELVEVVKGALVTM